MGPIQFTAWLLLVAVSALANAEFKPADPSLYVTDRLEIKGRVPAAISFSVADLRALPALTLSVSAPVHGNDHPRDPGQNKNDTGAATAQTGEIAPSHSYQGVLLRDLLQRAGIDTLDKTTVKKLAIIATASDHYAAVFFYEELFNTAVGAGVLVVYAEDGAALAAEQGHIALISNVDLHSSPRHVKWPQSIDVRELNP